jgi:hypothetical protein
MSTQYYLRRSQAAAYLHQQFGAYTTGTLAKLACLGGGPQFRKIGKYPVYSQADLDAWAASKMSAPVSSTSELGV